MGAVLDITSECFRRTVQFLQKLLHVREVFRYSPFKEVQEGRVIHRLGVHELEKWSIGVKSPTLGNSSHLVDAANPESKSTTLDTCPIHVVSNE